MGSRGRWTQSPGGCSGELGAEAQFVATGGHAAAIVPFCETIDEVDDLLTLTGLRLIWDDGTRGEAALGTPLRRHLRR